MSSVRYQKQSLKKTGVQYAKTFFAHCAIICISALGFAGVAQAGTVYDIITQPGIDAFDYYVHTDDDGWSMNTIADIDFGEGGNFGHDLYFTDNSLISRGRLYRLTDNNDDGDALGPGESSFIQYSSGRRPHALVISDGSGNFGTDLFLVDDGPNQIYRLNTFSTAYTVFSSSFWTPSEAEFTPDGSGLLIPETSNFTVYGGGADGLIYILDQYGNKRVWTYGQNIPYGLWDINTQAAMSPDGWLTFLDHTIRSGSNYLWQLVQFRDNNSDGDANDAGEGRVIVPVGMSGVAFRNGLAIDSNGDIYVGAVGGGTRKILKLKDLNNDGDFWNATTNDFDADEMSVFADNMPGEVLALGFAPDGELYAGASKWWDGPRQGVIVRFTTAADSDGDGVLDASDNCPYVPNPLQEDNDTDGAGDACDDDDDNDGVFDESDNCPTVANTNQDDFDGDDIGDACDIDIDEDGVENDDDNCPWTANIGQEDTDSDGDGDACDADDDNDGVTDEYDNCQYIANNDQSDADGDGRGDVCDEDWDGDGVANDVDNCKYVPNANQYDWNNDGEGDACDDDVDGDGVLNDSDLCEFTPLGETIDPSNGCSIVQLNPCDGPRGTTVAWKNHGKYVSSVARTADSFLEQGLITADEKESIVAAAAQSSCGSK